MTVQTRPEPQTDDQPSLTIEIQRGVVNHFGGGKAFVLNNTPDTVVLGINVVDAENPPLELRTGDHFQVGTSEWEVVQIVDLSPIPDFCPPGWSTGTVVAHVEQVSFRPRAGTAEGWVF